LFEKENTKGQKKMQHNLPLTFIFITPTKIFLKKSQERGVLQKGRYRFELKEEKNPERNSPGKKLF